MKPKKLILGLTLSAIAALSSSKAMAQTTAHDPVPSATSPYNMQVNISGATLFKSFFSAKASTNDFIDIDGDGVYGYNASTGTVDQLAADWTSFSSLPVGGSDMYVIYRGVGSGNGLAELLKSQALNVASTTAQSWYDPSRTGASTNVTYAYVPTNQPSDLGLVNRSKFSEGGVLQYSPDLTGGLSGSPIKQQSIDISVMDVPTKWFITQSGTGSWNSTPTSTGYGNNAVASWDVGKSNKLKSLPVELSNSTGTATETVTFNLNTSNPDDKTIFDTQIAFVPMGIIANRGVGSADRMVTDAAHSEVSGTGTALDDKIQAYTMSDLQVLYTTGRMSTGENLVAATRDSGSGTRNGTMNSIGVDPSYARGDNMGTKTDSYTPSYLGEEHQATNLGGSSEMQIAVANSRLAIGYQGIETAESKMSKGYVEHCAVMKDITGGTEYVFPTIEAMVDNGNVDTGWQIGGNETMATVGDPAETTVGNYTAAGVHSQTVANADAAAYILNITESIAAFSSTPSTSTDYFMPGEYMADNFLLVAALQARPGDTDGVNWVDQTATGENSQNTALANYIKSNSLMSSGGANEPGNYGSMDSQTPLRNAPSSGTYADGGTQDYVYYTNSAGGTSTLSWKTALSDRNICQGDFNNDKSRNIDDIEKLVECVNYSGSGSQTNGMLRWAYDDNVSRGIAQAAGVMPHIIGDFDGDGDLTKDDVRYFADGLAYDASHSAGGNTGLINRKQAFTDVDIYAGGNFFETKIKGQVVASANWVDGN
ncbi:MAG: hypothetical protein JXM70_02330, partial [Pirellulales bacterium]|nr:hypothetical protein [Pirellulales bacterium]